LRQKQAKITDSQSEFGDAALAGANKTDAAVVAYAQLAEDADLKSAIAKYNAGSAQPVKLGPSGNFANDAAFLKKCVSDLTAEGVPARMEGGVPVVEVNGLAKTLVEKRLASLPELTAGAGVRGEVDGGPKVDVCRFNREDPPFCYALTDTTIPDEFAVSRVQGGLRIVGTKVSDIVHIHGQVVGHFGKAVLIGTPQSSGTARIDVPYVKHHTTYYMLLQVTDGTVTKAEFEPQLGTDYSWSASPKGDRIVMEIRDKEAVLGSKMF
jgi:hypothetical protein